MERPLAVTRLLELVGGVRRGEISPREALARAARPETYESLDDEMTAELSREAWELTRDGDDGWRAGVTLHAILNAVRDAAHPDDELGATGVQLVCQWIGIASVALRHVPDPSLYADAVARGERAVTYARDKGKAGIAGDLNHALGTLHLDPYVALRDARGLSRQLHAWRLRARRGETWNGAVYYDIEAEGYPPPRDALTKAKSYYEAAIAAKTGRDRARSLKALAQTLNAFSLFDTEVDRVVLAQVAREALNLFDPAEDAALIAETTAYLRLATGEKAQEAAPEQWLAASLDASVAKLGADSTRVAVISAASNLLDTDPARAYRLLRDARPLFVGTSEGASEGASEAASEGSDATTYHLRVLRAFSRMHGLRAQDFVGPDAAPTEEAARGTIQRADSEGWDPSRLAGALIAIAESSIARNEESVGLRALAVAKAVAPITLAPVDDALGTFRAQLLTNDAVNAVDRADWDEATRQYSRALSAMLELGTAGPLRDLLDRLADVVRKGGTAAAEAVAAVLGARSDTIELVGGEPATLQLQEIYRLAVGVIVAQQGDAGALWSLVQLAKGRRFAAMLAAGSAHRVSDEDRDLPMLGRIARTRAEVDPSDAGGTAGDRLADEILLSPYAQDGFRLDGDAAAERLENLEHSYDVALHQRLVEKSAGVSGLLATADSVRDALDGETVLLQYYFPPTNDGESLLLASLTTREGTEWCGARVASGTPRTPMVIDGVEIENSYQSTSVQLLRGAINEDPGAGVISGHAQQILGSVSDLLLGPVSQGLEKQLAAGKSHLCIAPHGVLAYAPLHLLGAFPGTLSDDWTVTYLPNLQLLSTQQGGAALRRHRPRALAAFGLGFEDDALGYEAIPEAPREAAAVADAMHGTPVLDTDATEGAFRQALRESRYVHVATHGAHRPMAPAFHMFRLSPDAESDGDLYAYELLGMDLRGLELVTLSACDTILGRFDAGDNPHGLPATLFLAGARTIIGTLWEAESGCSEDFFTSLYRGLGAGKGKLEAFRHALDETRKSHPQFRDWGTFYFAGDWR